MILAAYRTATLLGGPLIRFYLEARKRRGKEDEARFGERLGLAGRARPDGAVVWLHGASVGEAMSALPLIRALQAKYPGFTVLVTTGTVTSARLMAERLPAGALHQFVPVDRAAYVRRFLDHWRPDVALWLESEFWPNMLLETRSRRIPMALINGRVSDRSFRTWQRFPGTIRRLLSCFDICLGQTEEDARRLDVLGSPWTACDGNIKFAAPPLPANEATLKELEAAFAGRPRWLAASTHAGEEAIAGRIHQALVQDHPGLLTVIVPRHPDRGGEIAAELTAMGLKVARRSLREVPDAVSQVYVADTLGELGLFYRLSGIAFVGRSLVPMGGQNPLEPARLGCAVAYGPHTFNFTEMTARMTAAGAATVVADEAALAALVGRWLADEPARAAAAQAAQAFAEAEAGVLEAVMDELEPYLAPLAQPGTVRESA